MRISFLLSSVLFFSACSMKDPVVVDTNLKTQTLMFSQKYKITQDKLNAIVTMSYLNPVLDNSTQDDVFALTLTPNTFKIQNLEVFINHRKAKIQELDQELFKYLLQNNYTKYFKVSLPGIKTENIIKAKICLNHLPCFELNFQKYPKSLYYRSEDIDTQYN
ncbi:hypothetical protein [Campylobacter aviculae]|uniref:Lipoprotein n=1 Tax=Campylobacter aviculae TaxID=2510190 RepID=A0A4V6DXM6_9BACT|nr:hypothetical protein [Campylobacter aviculae]TKX32492.1 hypothetical protein CQA76_04035 [Campylobacter aviculae]